MSGSLGFITSNMAGRAFDQQTDTLDRQSRQQDDARKRDEQRAVDEAVRGGLQEITAQPKQPAPAAPAPARPLVSPDDRTTFRSRIQSVEDPTGTAVNKQGFSGKYQFGTAALNAAGIYDPLPGEDLKTNQWKGTISLPDGRVMSHAQFVADGGAQDTAFEIHQKNLDREIAARGLDKYVGQNVGGRTITREDLYSAMHFAGPTGAERYLRSGGVANPADANRTNVSQYLQKVGGAPAAQPTPGPGLSAIDYSPIIRRVAATPGGSAVGLQTLQQQGQQVDKSITRADRQAELQRQQGNLDTTRTDRLTQQDQSRRDGYQKMAMEAFARGDVDAGKYYADQSGIQLPPEVMNNTGALKRLGDATTMATRLYGTDKAGAARFVQYYLPTGDAVEAINQAGVPARQGTAGGKVLYSVGPDGKTVAMMVDAYGNATPILDGAGEQVVRPEKPVRPNIQWSRNPDGTEQGMIVGPDGVARPMQWEGGGDVTRSLKPASGAAGGGRMLAIQVKEKMLIAAGFSPRDAAAMAAGATPSGNSLANIAQKISSDVEGDYRLADMTPVQKAEEKRRRLAEVRDLISTPTAAAPAPGSPPQTGALGTITATPPAAPAAQAAPAAVPPAPAPAPMPPPSGPPAGFVPGETPSPQAQPQQPKAVRPPSVPPGSVFSPSRNLWRDQNGRMYDQNGNPV